jgi:DNA-binding SARP family transcriptional activator
MALLAVLAGAEDHGITRDRAVALLWPESDEIHGRRHLSDALYAIHHELGPHAVDASRQSLVLNREVVQTDLAVFRYAVRMHNYAAAVAEYVGPFLDGFHLAGATAFEEWVTAEREHLALRYRACLEALALAAERAGQLAEAMEWWHELLRQDPFNSRVAMALARALLAGNDRGNALRTLEHHRAILREELDADTGHEMRSLIERARRDDDGP